MILHKRKSQDKPNGFELPRCNFNVRRTPLYFSVITKILLSVAEDVAMFLGNVLYSACVDGSAIRTPSISCIPEHCFTNRRIDRPPLDICEGVRSLEPVDAPNRKVLVSRASFSSEPSDGTRNYPA